MTSSLWLLISIGLSVSQVFAYDDIFSKPEYSITKNGFVRRSELSDEIAQLSNLGFSHEMLKLQNDTYLCSIPRPPLEERSVFSYVDPEQLGSIEHAPLLNTKKQKTVSDLSSKEVKAIRDKALDLWSPGAEPCLYYSWGWWTYKFCYGKEIDQFHQADTGDKNREPEPQEGSSVFTLGKFDSLLRNKPENGITSDGMKAEMIKNYKEVKVESNDNTNYLVYHLGQGTLCELTNSDRTIDVMYYCSPESTSDSILWVKELRSCHYQVAINTPKLCELEFFVPPPKTDPLVTNCKIILDTEREVIQYYIDRLEDDIEYFDETEL